ETRGMADHGWLKARHSFSFANYKNPERMNFGVLRVLNDDIISPGKGFGMHPHKDMEIITIPLSGDLEHQDNMGNKAVIHEGEVQVMSAGTGIYHSEYNARKDKEVKLLQIWLFPKKRSVVPRYDQIVLSGNNKNQWQQILSPSPDDAGVWIHQDAWFHLSNLEQGKQLDYNLKRPGNGMYFFVISGTLKINGQEVKDRDALGLWNTEKAKIESTSNARILLMEVPMLS
ncbi:MAG: pirin family protein, partial [Chitinophagales bacterium]